MAALSVLVRPKCGQRGQATWMQTIGAPLLASKRYSLMGMRMPAQDSRSAHGLLYLAAVWDDGPEQEHRQGCIDMGSTSLTAPEAVGLSWTYLQEPQADLTLDPLIVRACWRFTRTSRLIGLTHSYRSAAEEH